jgi:hypothetical protein
MAGCPSSENNSEITQREYYKHVIRLLKSMKCLVVYYCVYLSTGYESRPPVENNLNQTGIGSAHSGAILMWGVSGILLKSIWCGRDHWINDRESWDTSLTTWRINAINDLIVA